MRHALADGRQDQRQRDRARRRPLRRNPAHGRRDLRRGARTNHRRRRTQGRDLRPAQTAQRPRRRPGQGGVPRHPPPRVGLQPRPAAARERLPRRPRARRLGGHVREHPPRDGPAGPEPPAPPHRAARLPRRVHGRRPRAGDPGAVQADRPRGVRRPADQEHDRQEPARRRAQAAPRRAGVAVHRVRPERPRRGDGRGAPGARGPRRRSPDRRPGDRRQARSGQRLEGARERGRRQPRPRLHGRRGQLGGRRRPSRQARRVPARLPADPRRPRLPLRLLRPLRPGLRAHPDGLRPQERRRREDVPVVHGEVRRPRRRLRRLAGRRVRGGTRPRRAAAEDVRPRADAGVRRLQADLGPRHEDEPEPPDRRRQARRGPPAGPRLPAPAVARLISRIPTTAARSRPRSSGASAWPSAATSAA